MDGDTAPTLRRRSVIAGGLAAMLPVSTFRMPAEALPAQKPSPFASDLRLEGQLYAIIARPPVLGWTLAGVDARAAKGVRGVVDIVAIAPWGAADLARLGGVAVLARDTWSAMKGREALVLDWQSGPAPAAGHDRVGRFVVPETAEPLMETPCASARADTERCEVWACVNDADAVRASLADVLGLRRAAVTLHPTRRGGAPGRSCNPLGPIEAALLSRAMEGTPVSVVWTREDDMPFRARASVPVG